MKKLKLILFKFLVGISRLTTLKIHTIYFGFVFILILALPSILSLERFISFFEFNEKTGVIGDTIGGVTAPFVNFISAILVFYAFKEQIKANKLIQRQIKAESKLKREDEIFKYSISLLNKIQSDFSSLPEIKIKSYTFEYREIIGTILFKVEKSHKLEFPEPTPNGFPEFEIFENQFKINLENLINAISYFQENINSDLKKEMFFMEYLRITRRFVNFYKSFEPYIRENQSMLNEIINNKEIYNLFTKVHELQRDFDLTGSSLNDRKKYPSYYEILKKIEDP